MMRPVTEVLNADETIQMAWTKVGSDSRRSWLVRDPSGVMGIVTRTQLEAIVNHGELEKKVGDLTIGVEFPHLHTDQSFDQALARMGQAGTDMLPVVSRANVHEVLGVVWLSDVLKSYGVHGGEGI